jgi:hypothetical protein
MHEEVVVAADDGSHDMTDTPSYREIGVSRDGYVLFSDRVQCEI